MSHNAPFPYAPRLTQNQGSKATTILTQGASGLWSFSVGFYYGYGGTLTFGRDSGKSFAMFEAGVGLGGKLKYKNEGEFPAVPNKESCDKGGFLGFAAGGGGYLGPLALALEGKAGLGISKTGNALQTNYIESLKPEVGWQKRAWGLGLGIHAGVVGGLLW